MKVLIVLLLLFAFSCAVPPGERKDVIADRVSAVENGLQPQLQIQGEDIPTYNIEERLKELGIPGLSIAVINDGKIEWAKGYGIADSSENRPVTTETLFLAGSISKPVAATRAHQLAEQGVISLDTNVNAYLSSWRLPDNEFTVREKVTTRRILNHTAGLTVWGFPGYDKGDTIPSVPEVLDGMGNTDSVRVYKEPGESWMYSGGGYTIMQLMISDLEGKSFPEIMQSGVLDPLGMNASTFENPLPRRYHSIAATGYRANGDEVEGKWPIYPEMAAAGLWTTPSQLIRWAREIQRIYQSQEDGLLTAGTVNEMLTPGMNDHGLGPGVDEFTFGHGGADEGFRAQLMAWKERPVAVVVMVNSDNGSIMREVLLSLAAAYDLPGIEPTERSVKNLSPDQLRHYTGKYEFPGRGVVTLVSEGRGLEVSADFLDEKFMLLPETDTTFFNSETGSYFTFVMEEDTVVAMKVGDEAGKKIEKK